MKVRVQVIIESDSGAPETITEVASMPRDALQLEELGLTLAEAKAMLAAIQRTMVMAQAQAYVTQQQTCPHCGTPRVRKGQHTRVFRTVFGTVQVPSPRFYTCRCQPLPTG